jgi:hypothetical protein
MQVMTSLSRAGGGDSISNSQNQRPFVSPEPHTTPHQALLRTAVGVVQPPKRRFVTNTPFLILVFFLHPDTRVLFLVVSPVGNFTFMRGFLPIT